MIMNLKNLLIPVIAATMFASCSTEKSKSDKPMDDDKVSVTTAEVDQLDDPYLEEWPSIARHSCPEWFRDAKFGIFTCLGPASVATQDGTSEWYGWEMYRKSPVWWTNAPNHTRPEGETKEFKYHKEKYGDQKDFGYKDFIKLFKPEQFNAAEWAEVFHGSGAKFAGPVGIFHDNYLMWDSEISRWNSADMAGVDVTAELEKAYRDKGMKFLITYHHAFTWWWYVHSYEYDGAKPGNEDLYCRPHKFSDNNTSFDEYPDEEYEELWYDKLNESIEKFNPDLFWFDMGLELLSDKIRKKAFARILNNAKVKNQDVGICYKIKYDVCIPPSAGILDYEKGRSTTVRKDPWLSDTPLAGWYYNGKPSRTPEAIIEILCDITSKNGCLQLCVSPKPDGTIPEDQKQTLAAIGEWLDMNGEAIYSTRPWLVAEEGPTKLAEDGHFNENWEAIYGETDIRYTRSKDNNTLYVIVLDKPTKGKVVAKKLGTVFEYLTREVKSVELIGTDAKIEWKQNFANMTFSFPENANGKHAFCYKLTLEPEK